MGVSVFKVPRRLYWVADRSRLVGHGDPEAAFLAFTSGHELSLEEARRFGLLESDDAPVLTEKHREITRNKMRGRPLDKAAVVEQTTTETTVVKEKP